MPIQPTTPQAPTPNVGGFVTAARAKGVPDTQIYSYLQGKGYMTPPAQTAKPAFTPAGVPALTSDRTSHLSDIGDQASSGANTFMDGVKEATPHGDLNPLNLVEGVGKILGGAAGVVTSPLAPAIKPVSNIVHDIGNKVADTPLLQAYGKDTASLPADEQTAPERVAGTIANYANAAGTVAGGEETIRNLPDTIAKVKSGINTVKTGVADATQSVKNSLTPDPALAKTQSKTQAAVNSAAADWQKPATINKPGFAKPKAILANSPDTPKFLAEQGLNPSAHIEDGKYNTSDTAEALRNTAAKMSNDTLRPSLQMADYTTPKTPVTDILKQTEKNIEADKELTDGEKEVAKNNAAKEAAALQKNNPNGMSLTDMHDSKITYAGKGGYSPIKDPAADVKAASNRAMASAFQKTVEDKAPASVPVKPFNQYLSKYFKGADYLDSLNGKTAPVTVGQQIARGAAKYGGAMVGAKFGGGVVSEFAGYQIGKALEHAAENLTNPMRASYLRNLEVTNPQAFTRVKAYLEKQSSGNTDIPRLPSPSFTPLGPDTTPVVKPSVAPHAATGGYPLPRDPKTGKVMRVYTSEPKGK